MNNVKNDEKRKKSKTSACKFREKNDSRCNLWKPGEPLTENDLAMLKEVQDTCKKLGYTPRKKEVGNVIPLKRRFRTWKDVIAAAGLPHYNDPEEVKRRQQILKQNNPPEDKL